MGPLYAKVDDHLVGRFCLPTAPFAQPPESDSGGSQVRGGRFAPYPSSPLNPPQRPSQASQGNDLLVEFAQDVTHPRRVSPSRAINVLSEGLSLAGFQLIMYGRFWVITEGLLKPIFLH